jgi:hypothetical protein
MRRGRKDSGKVGRLKGGKVERWKGVKVERMERTFFTSLVTYSSKTVNGNVADRNVGFATLCLRKRRMRKIFVCPVAGVSLHNAY